MKGYKVGIWFFASLFLCCQQAAYAQSGSVVNIGPYSIGGSVGSPLFVGPGTSQTFPVSAMSLPLPSNAAQETGGVLGSISDYIGATGSGAATADTGTFNLNAFIQRMLEHQSTIITTLGSPLQAGGSVELTDGTNIASVAAASTAAVATNKSLVVGLSPNSPLWGIKDSGGTSIIDATNHALYIEALSGGLVINPSNLLGTDGLTFSASATLGNNIFCLNQGSGNVTSNPLGTGKAGLVQCGPYRNLLISQIDSAGNDMTDTTNHSLKSGLVDIGGNSVATAASGVQKVGIVGNSGAAVDAALGSTPTNAVTMQGGAGMVPVNNSAQAATSNANAGYSAPVSSTPTVTASSYSSGNCLGGFNSVTVAGNNAQTGLLTNVEVSSVTGVTATVTVYMFEANPSSSTCTDHSTFTLNSADISKLIAAPTQITLAAPTGATPSTAEIAFAPPRPFVTGSSAKTIYYAMVAGASFTPGSTSDFQVRVGTVMN